jgi:hypothetical protein
MKFEIGEIAIVQNVISEGWNGREVTINSALFYHSYLKRMVYRIDSSQLPPNSFGRKGWCLYPDQLRKRPQPPDWNALADPRKLPIEELAQ